MLYNLRFCLNRFEFGDVVARYVALLLGGFRPGKPPVALSVVDDLQMFSFLEAEVLVCPGVIVVERDKNLEQSYELARPCCVLIFVPRL